MKTFFVLGSHPTLSLAEMSATLGQEKNYSQASEEVLILNKVKEKPTELIEHLAGLIKIGEIVGEQKELSENELTELVFALCQKRKREKVIFGISCYCLDNRPLYKKLKKHKNRIGLKVKKLLKEEGYASRFVTSRSVELSSVIVRKNKLLEQGGEFVLIASKQGVLIGETRAVQDFEVWSKRDYGRPARDPKRGMLPPKLARIMCNLAIGKTGTLREITLADPFCGMGTILIEAAMLGVKKIIGSDIDQKAINASEKNLNWLAEEFGVNISNIHLMKCAAEAIDSCVGESRRLSGQIDLIVTEPYLGPPQTGRETQPEVEKIVTELMTLYVNSFRNIAKILRKGATTVVTLPVFQIERKKVYIPVIDQFKKIGFRVVDPLPKSAATNGRSPLRDNITPRGGILYKRKGQRVGREIIILKFG